MNINKHSGFLLSLLLGMTACSDSGAPAPQLLLNADAIEVNNQAVGLMGRFEFAQALTLFSDLLSQQPEWNEVKVNLAIATLNRQQAGDDLAALALAREVLQAEPGNLRARYLAGLVQLYIGAPQDALSEFQNVAEADPADAYAAYYLAQCQAQLGNYDEALPWYQHAIKRDPYLRSAYYGAFQSLQRLGRPQEAQALADNYQRLENNPRSRLAEFKYTRMGPRAEAVTIDLQEEPVPQAPEGELFSGPEPVLIENESELHWQRFPINRTPSVTTVDMQGDGLPDLFISGVLEISARGEAVGGGNLILQGQPGNTYTALTEHPLAQVSGVNAALWGDFDNDGLVDVYLCRSGANQLWRQIEKGEWRDVTISTLTAGGDLDTVDGAFFDADHDGDLDLFLVNGNGPNELLSNNLDGTFRPLAQEFGLAGSDNNSLTVVPVDLDNDRDVDLIVLNRTKPHQVFINDRLWSYHLAGTYDEFNNRPALAAVAADIDADGQTEIYTVTPSGDLLRWLSGANGEIQAGSLGNPELLKDVAQAQLAAHDVNGDGVLDLVVSSPRGWTVFAVGSGGVETLFEAPVERQNVFSSVLPFIGTSKSGPAMLVLSELPVGLSVWQPGPGRYSFITLALSGRQDDAESMRSNASGTGAALAVRTGSRWSLLHNYRTQSGPGQSLQPLAIGLKGAPRADFISIDWSDGVLQTEINLLAGQAHQITETQRQLSSCPVLFAWNGEQYAFISDFLGVGGMGYSIGPGEYSTPRPWENFLLPEGLLQAKNGRYELKIAEPMEEIAYIDAARLVVYDLPAGWNMVMDERMGISAPEPTGEARFYRHELQPASAINDRGEDVLASVLTRDGAAAPVGHLDHRFIGRLQDEHILTMEFPQSLDSVQGEPLLIIDGWVEYPYSQTNFAAWQAGADYAAPTLEAFDGKNWQMVLDQFGYPAGMPRSMSVPLSGLPGGTTRLRLRTNMQIYWDRIAVAFSEDLSELKKQNLPLVAATLSKTGFARRDTFEQFRPDYDYADLSPFWDTRYMAGYYTRLGSVEELVTASDDAMVIIGPGEEVHLEFDAAVPAAPGWQQFFVLETNGWAKDMDLFTRDGETVGPLPSTGKPEAIRDSLHARYNTRYLSGY